MADLLAILRLAVRARLLDERLTQLARAGRIGFHPDAHGFEPAIAAAVLAMRETDAIFPSARDHLASLARGTSIATYVAHALGSASDPMHGHATPGHFASRAGRIGSPSGIIAAHLTHAAGFAWAAQMRGDPCVVLALCGESAANAGDFHSALNFAGATRSPVIFLVRSDRSVPPRMPAPTETVAEKAIAYGLDAQTASADDPESVGSAIESAIDRAPAPSVIEVLRARPDPLDDLRSRLIESGAWDRHRDMELRRETMAEIEAAVSSAQAEGPPPRDAIFEDTFGALPAHLHDQKSELLR